jgi:hypothetical protein
VLSEPTVTVAEIAAAMGRRPADVEREAAELGMLVKPDWAGRRACRSPTLGVWHPVRPGATSNTTAAGNTSSATRKRGLRVAPGLCMTPPGRCGRRSCVQGCGVRVLRW